MRSRWKDRANAWAAPLGAALGYFALATATILLTSDGRSHATVWAADAVVLALLLTRPRAAWPAILWAGWIANLAANIATRGWGPWLVLYGAINMAQVLFAAHMLRRHRWEGGLLADGASLGRFVLWAGVAAPATGAVLGGLAGAINFGMPFWPSFPRWYASSALGLLILTPFLADLVSGEYGRSYRSRGWRSRAEQASLLALAAGVALLVFLGPPLPILFATFIPLIVAAFRIGRLGVQAGVLVIALVGAVATVRGLGPFAALSGSAIVQTYAFQFYLAAIALTALPVAAVVGARHDALLGLHEREETLRLLMAHSADVLLRFDPAGTCLSAHGPIDELLGISARRMIGASVLRPGARVEPAAVAAFAATLSSGAVSTAELVLPHRPGVTLEAAFKAVMDNGEATAVVATVRDITARTRAEAILRHAADTDGLTGLLNRSGFEKRLEGRLTRDSGPATLAMIDVDRFKSVNDANGHQVGDAVLVEIARRLVAGVRADDVVARLGGDEFVILFASDRHDAHRACERIAESVARRPVHHDGNVAVLTSLSCGIATWCADMSPADLIGAADLALYDAKRGGRNCVRAAAG